MSRSTIERYAYLVPPVLAPLTFWLWWRRYEGALDLTLVAWLVPIVYAYVVPGVGTNVLRVWEFDTRMKLGRFRPHHGFVFGSATAALAWLSHSGPVTGVLDVLRAGIVMGSVLGFANVLYDVKAIEAGVLRVYNQPWAEGRGPAAIVMDYAPWFFGGFGAVYGAGIATAELLAARGVLTRGRTAALAATILICAIAVPVLGYRRRSFRLHGHSGCRPVSHPELCAKAARRAVR